MMEALIAQRMAGAENFLIYESVHHIVTLELVKKL